MTNGVLALGLAHLLPGLFASKLLGLGRSLEERLVISLVLGGPIAALPRGEPELPRAQRPEAEDRLRQLQLAVPVHPRDPPVTSFTTRPPGSPSVRGRMLSEVGQSSVST